MIRWLYRKLTGRKGERYQPGTLESRASHAFQTLDFIARNRDFTAEELRSYARSALLTIGEYD